MKINNEEATCVFSSIVGKFEALLASARAFLKRLVREESGSMIKSSIGHVIRSALLSLSPLSVNALTGRSLSCLSAPPHPRASPEAAARNMSKRAMPPLDGHKSGKRKNPGQSVNQMPTQITARDIPMYFKKQSPLDPEVFVYVEVVIIWPDSRKVSLTDVRMSEAKFGPARFPAFFTGDCTGFLRRVEVGDKLCLYLSDATVHGVEGQCEQNTLNLPFTLTYDKTCRLKYVEKGIVGHSITFPTRT